METKSPDMARAFRVALATKNVRQYEIAKRVGISTNHASRLAKGHVLLQGELLNKVAAALGMKVSELIALGED